MKLFNACSRFACDIANAYRYVKRAHLRSPAIAQPAPRARTRALELPNASDVLLAASPRVAAPLAQFAWQARMLIRAVSSVNFALWAQSRVSRHLPALRVLREACLTLGPHHVRCVRLVIMLIPSASSVSPVVRALIPKPRPQRAPPALLAAFPSAHPRRAPLAALEHMQTYRFNRVCPVQLASTSRSRAPLHA